MKKILTIAVLSAATLALLSSCASKADTMVSPSPAPTNTVAPVQTKKPETSMMPGNTDNPTDMEGTVGKGVMTMADSTRVSEQVAEEVEKLSELDDAEALVVDDVAVVGIRYDDQYQGGLTQRMKDMVKARVQAVDKNVTKVYVVEGTEDYTMLEAMKEKMKDSGFTLDQLRQELKTLTDRLLG